MNYTIYNSDQRDLLVKLFITVLLKQQFPKYYSITILFAIFLTFKHINAAVFRSTNQYVFYM